MKIAAWSFLLICATAMGQTNTCPLQPTVVKNVASQIAVSFQNLSNKQLAGYRFGLTFYDGNGRARAFPQALAETVSLKSHGKRTAIWHSSHAGQFLLPSAKVYLLDAKFADGTDWSDDGTQSCSVTSIQE